MMMMMMMMIIIIIIIIKLTSCKSTVLLSHNALLYQCFLNRVALKIVGYINKYSEMPRKIPDIPRNTAGTSVQQLGVLEQSPRATNSRFVF